jgi:tetratricopeptide (TPR) repeat protein
MVMTSSGRQRQWLGALALCTFAYLVLATKEFAASHFGFRSDLPSLERAVLISPGNADYQHRLGRYFAFVAGNPQAAIQRYQTAAGINPHQSRYWFDLASAYQSAGNVEGQRAALERAAQAEPTAPDVAWEAANFFLVEGDTNAALREFHVVMDSDPTMALFAMGTCWRVLPDANALLQNVVPRRTDSLLTFLSMMESKNEADGAILTWNHLIQLNQKFEISHLLEYVRYLVRAHRPEAAAAAWEQAAGLLNLSAYLPNPDNLIVNGDFSLDILNGGFDWSYQTQPGVSLQLDSSDFREGQRSLSIAFEGPGIADAGIRQWIPVHPAAKYDFTVYYKSSTFQGAGGPQIVLRDLYTGQALYTSDPLIDADFWKAVHGRVTVPEAATILVLNIERIPAGSPMRGKIWLDDFELSPQASEVKP